MFTLKHFNRVDYAILSTVHRRTFATLEEALADAKRTIDLDIETECPSCDEIHVINDEGETVNCWLWCPDDIGAPFSWHEN